MDSSGYGRILRIRRPEGETLRPYQEDGIRHLMSGKRKLLLDDPGLGKSAQLLVAARSLGATTLLLVVPPATRWGWAEEIPRWTGSKYRVQVLEGMMSIVDPKATCVIVSYSLLSSPMVMDQLKARRWSVMGIDEVHWCKTVGTVRTDAVLGGRANGLIKNSVYVWGLSGTLMTNTPIDLFAILRAMARKDLGKYVDQTRYAYRYCGAYRGAYGIDMSGASRLPELHDRIFGSGLGLRRRKKDVLKELPDLQYRLMPIDGNSVTHQAFKKWDDCLKEADFSGSLPVPGSELARARKEVSIAKMAPMVDYVNFQLEERQKILQFFWHKVGLNGMDLDLKCDGIESACYYGETSAKNKELNKKAFISGDVRVLNANIKSAGTGLDGFQKSCNYGVFYDIPWCFTEIEQCAGRLHRFGQNEKVVIDIPVIIGSAEQYVMKKVFKKKKYFKELLTL